MIKTIETFHQKHLCVVRIITEDGIEGWGQTAHMNADITSQILHRMLAPLVLGKDSRNVEALSDSCIERTYKFYGSYICRAAAGIDTALWDIRAKRANKSVAALLGSSKTHVDVYGSSMDRSIIPIQEAERMKRLKYEKGFRAFKLHIASGIGMDEDVYPGRTEEIVPLVRRAIGDDAMLSVDPNGAYSVPYAIKMGHFFGFYGIAYFEEPCPFWEFEKSAEVARSINIPIAGGEQDFCLSQWQRIINTKAVAIAQPDILYIGGLTRALRVSDMANQAGLLCSPHNATFGMLQVFSIHMNAVIPNPHPFLEFSIDQDVLDPFTRDFFYPQVEVDDGRVKIPEEPGWGISINTSWLEKATYTLSELNS